LSQRCRERVLHGIFGQIEVTQYPNQRREHAPRGLLESSFDGLLNGLAHGVALSHTRSPAKAGLIGSADWPAAKTLQQHAETLADSVDAVAPAMYLHCSYMAIDV